MAIYDILVLGSTATGMQLLPPGNLGIYTFTLAPMNGFMISLLHVAQTEDFSVRAWFSTQPGGESIITGTYRVIPLARLPTVFVFYDLALPIIVPPGAVPLPVPPGTYIMNFLNLANAENIFSFKIERYTGALLPS